MDTIQNEVKQEIEEPGCCFCFRREDIFSLLDLHEDEHENYVAMITDCFQIDINVSNEIFHKSLYVICKFCIISLKDSCRFRIDVQNGLKRIQDIISDVRNEVEIEIDFPTIKEQNELSDFSIKQEKNKKDDMIDNSGIVYDVPLMYDAEMDCKNETKTREYENKVSESVSEDYYFEMEDVKLDYESDLTQSKGVVCKDEELEIKGKKLRSTKIANKSTLGGKGVNSEQYQIFLESLRHSKSQAAVRMLPVKKKDPHEYISTLNRDQDVSTLAGMVCDEKTAVEFFQICGIIPRQKLCDNGHEMCMSFSDTPPLWKCQTKYCRLKRGIRQNTWLQNSKMTFRVTVQFIYYWSKEMTSLNFCAKELKMSNPSVIDWNNQLREVCVWRINQCNPRIGGEGLHVDIDETIFNNPENNIGKNIVPQWIFAGICRETKDCFIVPVSEISIGILYPIVVEMIKPGSIIISNNWRAFDLFLSSNSTMKQYKFVSPKSTERNQDIEKLWMSAKLSNKKRKGTSKNYLKSYIAELVWKLKLDRRDPFEQILRDIVAYWEATK